MIIDWQFNSYIDSDYNNTGNGIFGFSLPLSVTAVAKFKVVDAPDSIGTRVKQSNIGKIIQREKVSKRVTDD